MGGDAPNYRGPEQIHEYYHAAYTEINRKVRGIEKIQPCPYPQESQRAFLTLWVMATRESEALMLEPSQFKISGDSFGYRKTPVLKKREKVRDKEGNIIYRKVPSMVIQQDGSTVEQVIYRPLSKRKAEYREHVVPRDMPLVEEYIKTVDWFRDHGYRFIMFRTLPFSKSHVKDEACSVTTLKDRVTELHPELFPHALRALHVRYMFSRYGDKLDIKKHLKWSSDEMVKWYLSSQKIASVMDISVPW